MNEHAATIRTVLTDLHRCTYGPDPYLDKAYTSALAALDALEADLAVALVDAGERAAQRQRAEQAEADLHDLQNRLTEAAEAMERIRELEAALEAARTGYRHNVRDGSAATELVTYLVGRLDALAADLAGKGQA